MKRFLLFAGNQFENLGGWDDLISSFETEKDAMEAGKKLIDDGDRDWYHIVDLDTGQICSHFPICR